MLCIDPYYTALPGSPVSYAYYGRHPVLRMPIIQYSMLFWKIEAGLCY